MDWPDFHCRGLSDVCHVGFTEVDRAWFKSIEHYIRNEDEKMPPAGRYNAGQKMLFWGFLICGTLLLLSGLVLWFPEHIPWSWRYLRYISVIVHPGAALLTIGLFLIHIYMGVFAERGAFGSVIRGDVSLAFAKRYHPGWYKEITGEAPPPHAAGRDQAPGSQRKHSSL